LDPENSLVLMETNLPNPTTARVYVNLPEGNDGYNDDEQIFFRGVEKNQPV